MSSIKEIINSFRNSNQILSLQKELEFYSHNSTNQTITIFSEIKDLLMKDIDPKIKPILSNFQTKIFEDYLLENLSQMKTRDIPHFQIGLTNILKILNIDSKRNKDLDLKMALKSPKFIDKFNSDKIEVKLNSSSLIIIPLFSKCQEELNFKFGISENIDPNDILSFVIRDLEQVESIIQFNLEQIKKVINRNDLNNLISQMVDLYTEMAIKRLKQNEDFIISGYFKTFYTASELLKYDRLLNSKCSERKIFLMDLFTKNTKMNNFWLESERHFINLKIDEIVELLPKSIKPICFSTNGSTINEIFPSLFVEGILELMYSIHKKIFGLNAYLNSIVIELQTRLIHSVIPLLNSCCVVDAINASEYIDLALEDWYTQNTPKTIKMKTIIAEFLLQSIHSLINSDFTSKIKSKTFTQSKELFKQIIDMSLVSTKTKRLLWSELLKNIDENTVEELLNGNPAENDNYYTEKALDLMKIVKELKILCLKCPEGENFDFNVRNLQIWKFFIVALCKKNIRKRIDQVYALKRRAFF